jgi:hypothetical protein
LQGEHVGVKPPPTDAVAAGMRQEHLAAPSQQRTGEDNGAAQFSGEGYGQSPIGFRGSADGDSFGNVAIGGNVNTRAELSQNFPHDFDIFDGRDIFEHDRLISEAASRQ